MLKVKNVTKFYGENKAVDNLSFEVKEGEIFGLLGANGAGKTTTFRMIMNLLEPSKGEITLNNKKIDYDVTDSIGFLTEERSLLLKLTVKELMLYYGTLKSMKKDEIITELRKWLKRFKIEDYENRKIKELSKGNKQKIQFISSIIHKPKLLILDEPFSGLDPINVDMFIDVINELKEKGTIIIFSSHQMNHVELFCEKLLILDHGKTIIEGNLKDIKSNYDERKILIKADVTKAELSKLDGVKEITIKGDEIEVKIDDKKYAKNIFEYISKCKNVTKFEVVELSLHEIFTKEVGGNYEK
ncbi:MAG: ATP-binding cassette domain-containing protein [Bacilli bacterium]|nr:ATP-binding cassette domain-containing protein [Bacilli bacterium]